MARVTREEAENMTTQGEFSYLSLKNRESKSVRFLCVNPKDIEIYSVHSVEVTVDGQKKSKAVDCLRAANEPVQMCPLCAAGNRPRARVYLLLQDVQTGGILLWERSPKFLEKLDSLFDRYAQERCNFYDIIFDIERRGEKGDPKTEYDVFFKQVNPLSELPELPQVMGKLVLQKNAQEMDEFINTGSFPQAENNLPRRNEQQPTEVHRPEQQSYQQNQSNWNNNQNKSNWGGQETRRGW